MMLPPTVLALEFSSPALLWGMLLAAVPMVLHLLFRSNQPVEPWAAMQFLRAAVRRRRNRLRLESLLHLLVRSALLAVIPLALAQPRLSTEGRGLRAGRPVHRVLVVDTSMSMGADGGAGTPFETARQHWRDLLAEYRPGDSFQLVQTRAHGPRAMISKPSFDARATLAELDSLVRTQDRGALQAALEDARLLLKSAPRNSERQVVLFTDMQRADWVAENGAPRRGLRSVLGDLAEQAELVLLDCGLPSPVNVTVADLKSTRDWHFVGQPSEFQITVRCDGGALERADLDLLVDGVPHSRRQVDLSDGKASVTAELTFSAPGEHVVTATIGDDFLADDNQRQLVVDVARSLRILLVGRDSKRASAAEHDYVLMALDPPWDGGDASETRFDVQLVGETELRQLDLAGFDCVLLRNVGFVSLQEAERLREFVRKGGGLIIAPGEQVEIDSFNSILGAAVGLAPARLVEMVGGANRLEMPFTFETDLPDHPIVRPFQQFPGSGFTSTRIYRHFATSELASDAAVPVRLSSGDPLLIDRAAGRGRVLMLTTALNHDWGSWVVWPSFLPMLHESMQYASAGRVRRSSLEVGETIEWPRNDPAGMTIECPDGRLAHPQHVSGSATLSFGETGVPGIYRVAVSSDERFESFSVNVPAEEGALQHVAPADLAKSTLAGIDFQSRLNSAVGDPSISVARSQDGDLSTILLMVGLLLLITDVLSSWSFAAGVSLLISGACVGLLKAFLPIEWVPAALVTGGLTMILLIAARATARNQA